MFLNCIAHYGSCNIPMIEVITHKGMIEVDSE
uniref:Uncharacterized protein n=1 Tax=Rhizophora mucronata TaxID=61149 RepID=A0A2P2PX82_RHIMU